MASIILPPGSAPASPSEGELYYDNTAKQVKFRDNAGFKALGTADLQGEPHIITKKLFPAYLGKLLDDTTSHSGNYGTEQADGRMYYYTDIAGSKPIHDPRIGTHFGTQRHLLKSVQLLEQETATHGSNVYSVDGRNWIRCCATDKDFYTGYDANGSYVACYGSNSSSFFEITGYFNGINFSGFTHTTRGAEFSVNGGSVSTSNFFTTSAMTPIRDRYVSHGSYQTLTSSLTLGINTIKIIPEGADTGFWFGVELIAQDTTSSSTKVQIQVPAQDVVSYGRKFSVSATTQHYDPFNGFTSGSSVSSYVDTATSLGLSKWLHSSTYYRPYNGMRVVKWIDENGAIKTSVTCMPPNAKSIADSSSLTNANAKANASVANNTFYPTFEAHTTSINEDNLHEVAKTFHVREFGNGAANGGAGATWADASMLNTTDDIGYCMDDGTTSLSGDDAAISGGSLYTENTGDRHITFIGTGITVTHRHTSTGNASDDHRVYIDGIEIKEWDGTSNTTTAHQVHYAQNLPFGTHILKIDRLNAVNSVPADDEYTFHQPKKPLIPDSACVLADYMVFADFKPQTTAGAHLISKGVRKQNISRDVFFDETDGDSFTFGIQDNMSEGFEIYLSGNADSDTSMKMRIPSFGTNYVHRGYQSDTRTKLFIGDTDNDSTATKDNTATYGSYAHLTTDLTLGVHQFGANAVSGQNGLTGGFDIVTPIHTSHHYQSFETPFLHELIGGDRSMEQTNLICSSDGKSWDEITRDTSYIGGRRVLTVTSTVFSWSTNIIFDAWRGASDNRYYSCKDFAIAYDGLICLKAGQYRLLKMTSAANSAVGIYLNDYNVVLSHVGASGTNDVIVTATVNLDKGDFIQVKGENQGDVQYNTFQIDRIN